MVAQQVEQAGVEKVLDPRYIDRVSVNLERHKDRAREAMASNYIDRVTAERAAAKRQEIVGQFVSQAGR